jgi:dCMP deaminase
MDWDTYFMTMVYLIAMRSKDKSTKIGAVAVNEDNIILSCGYNGFPRGINDQVKERQERPEKYFWMGSHAERNVIFNAAYTGVPLKGSKLYTNGIPCMDCACGIINSGIKEVITHKEWNDLAPDIWREHAERTKIIFQEAGVALTEWDGKIQSEIFGWNRNNRIDL